MVTNYIVQAHNAEVLLHADLKRQAELRAANFKVFMTRAHNPEYGTMRDREDALKQAVEENYQYREIMGVNLAWPEEAEKV